MKINNKVVAVALSLSLIICIGGLIYYFVSQPPPPPPVLITYHGENTVPEGLTGFPSIPEQFLYYSWNLTMTNLNPTSGISVPAERAVQPLVSKYPELVSVNTYVPNEGYTGNLTLLMDSVAIKGNMARQCFVIFAKSHLSSDQIISLTEDLNTYLAPALVEWYS
jgi:hypothetical protein